MSTLVVAIAAVIGVCLSLAVMPSSRASAIPPFPINDSGSGPAGKLDPDWSYIRTGNSVGNTYTSDGWLRLTSNTNNQETNILNNTAFKSSTGFRLSFDYRQAGGTKFTGTDGTGRTGDGIAMYLIDGTQQISAGGAGNGLGYANSVTNTSSSNILTCGVKGGYLGLGLDVYGNYSVSTKGNYGGPDDTPRIGLRGSGNSSCASGIVTAAPATNQTQYPWVDGAPMNLWTGTTGSTADPATVAGALYRHVSITVLPSNGNVQVTVAISASQAKNAAPGAMTTVFTHTLSNVAGQVQIPANLKLGFSASTGSSTDYHDVRNIQVSALADLSITKSLSSATPGHDGYPAGTFLPGDPIAFTLNATDQGPTDVGNPPDGIARVYDDLSGLPIQNVTWSCTGNARATCVGSGGSGSTVIQDWYGPAGSSVTVTVQGTLEAMPGQYTNTAIIPTDLTNNTLDPNEATVQPDNGLVDTDLTNNTASTTFTILGPHFTQTKSADKSEYTVGDPITYTVAIANDGAAAGQATVTDDVPDTVEIDDVSCSTSGTADCAVDHTGNSVTGTVSAPAGDSATFTITGKVVAGPDAKNVAVITPTTPGCGSECGGGDASTPDLPVSTLRTISIQKTGQTTSGSGPVDGTQFTIFSDDDGSQGTALSGTVTPVAGKTGLYQYADLAPGTYWLTETAAPAGHSLLPQAVKFTLTDQATISIADPEDNPQISASGLTITVRDVHALTLPMTGASGSVLFGWSGLIVLALAALLMIILRRRWRTATAD